jgi:hypothetical protein
MSYPPQGGGWQDQQGSWQQPQPGGWQDPAAGGYANPSSGQPAYVDPSSGQPAYADPVSGQPAGYPQYPATYPTSPGYGYEQTYPGYNAPVTTPTARTNGLAIASLVVSLVALVSTPCYGIGGIVIGAVGAILGHVGKRQITERGEQGGGMAMAGIIIGWISLAIGIIVLVLIGVFVWWAANQATPYPTSTY